MDKSTCDQDDLRRPPRLAAAAAALLAIGPFFVRAQGPASSDPPRLDSPEAVARAVLVANPELASLGESISALEHAVPQAGAWPDPMASIENSNVPLEAPYPGGHMMAGLQFRLQQTVPFPGKTAARTAVARSMVDGAREMLAERRNRLSGMVRELYHRLALVRQLRGVTEQHVALVKELIGAVRARYETGGAPQHDLLQLRVQRDRLTDELDEFTRKDRELAAALRAAVHVPADTPIETPAMTPLPPELPELATLVGRAAQDRPLLRALESQSRTASLAARRAETEGRPDVTLWLGYRYRRPAGMDTGVDLYSAGLSIPLPWFWNDRRWGELARQETARERSFEAERSARLDEIRGRIDGALARWGRAAEKARFYETTLVPEQRQTLASAVATYRVGRAEFATLYRAELELLDFERAIRTAHTDAALAAVEVDILTGGGAGASSEKVKP